MDPSAKSRTALNAYDGCRLPAKILAAHQCPVKVDGASYKTLPRTNRLSGRRMGQRLPNGLKAPDAESSFFQSVPVITRLDVYEGSAFDELATDHFNV